MTPRDAAEGADVVFAMVGDDEASEHVWMGGFGRGFAADLKPGTIVVECSTLSHDWVMSFPQSFRRRAIHILIVL